MQPADRKWKQSLSVEASPVRILNTDTFSFLSFLSPTQAYSSILVAMVILLNIGVAILFIHFFI